jgi:glycosyltransferase involved in cell wall biosynthesis
MSARLPGEDNWKDSTEKEADSLQRALEAEVAETLAPEATAVVPVREAKRAAKVLEVVRERTNTRPLMVSDDPTLLLPGSAAQQELLSLASYFDEIHCLVVTVGRRARATQRLAPNVYCYQVTGGYWWSRLFSAYETARKNLVFHGAVRPDYVVSTSPGEAGRVGWLLQWYLKRPWQVQVRDNPYDVTKLITDPDFKAKRRLANFVLRRADSVRTGTEKIQTEVLGRVKRLTDVEVLPHHYNLAAYQAGTPLFDVHERYPDYVFIMLAHGPLTADSSLHDTFAAAKNMLKNPRIGLIVIGTGPAKTLFEEKVKLLGMERNVVFVTKEDDLVSYYKTADLFIETSTGAESEEHILRAIGAAIPIVAYETPLRTDLIENGESSFLCEPRDSYALGQQLTAFLNSNRLRTQFRQRLREVVAPRLSEDPTTYLLALRDSMDGVLRTLPANDSASQS